MKKFLAAALGAAMLWGSPHQANSAEYELSFNLPVSSTNSQWTDFLKPWVEELEKRSGGRIHVETYFAGALSPMSECFNTVKEGLADLTEAVLATRTASSPTMNAPGKSPTPRSLSPRAPASCTKSRKNSRRS